MADVTNRLSMHPENVGDYDPMPCLSAAGKAVFLTVDLPVFWATDQPLWIEDLDAMAP